MKTRSSIISLLCTATLMLSFCSCATLSGYLTESKEDVLLRLTQYIDGRTPTSATAAIDFTMASELNGSPAEITVSVKSETLIASETDSYSEGEFSYTINGQNVQDSSQVYNFTEDGKLLTFTHVDSTDRWHKSEAALSDLQSDPTPAVSETEDTADSIPERYEFLLLEEGTQTLDNREVYVLTGSVDGDACAEILNDIPVLDALAARLQSTDSVSLSDLDFSSLTADIVVFLDKETCAPVQAEITVGGLNLLITDVMSMLPPQSAALLGSSVTIEPIRMVLSDIGFDPVTTPEVTEEMRIKAALDGFAPDQGDGTFVLHRYTDAVKITAQSGWTLTELGHSYAVFHNPEHTRSAVYELYENTTGEEFITLVKNGMIPAIEAQDLTVIAENSDAIGDYQTYSIRSDGMNVYLAYRTVGNYLLGIYAEDATKADLNSVLTPILEAVEDYQIEY